MAHTLSISSFPLLAVWSCILCLPFIHSVPSLADLLCGSDFTANLSHGLATVSLYWSLCPMRSFPSGLSPDHRANSVRFLLNTDFPLVVRSEFIKRFCKRGRCMFETLAT